MTIQLNSNERKTNIVFTHTYTLNAEALFNLATLPIL